MADVWYPSLWVRIQLRFEDFRSAKLAETLATLALEPSLRGDPVDKAGFSGLDVSIIPRTAQVVRNSYRRADEAKVTIPYGRIPLDPRIIRMGTIQIFAGSIAPKDFAATMGIIPGADIALAPEIDADGRSNEIFRGFIDDWGVELQGDDTIEITARDITGILIDQELPVDGLAGIPRTMPLDQVVKAMVAGEAAATGVIPDQREKRAGRLAARKEVRQLTKLVAAKSARQARASAAGDTLLAAALAAEVAGLQAQLAVAQTAAESGDAVPVLAARYGLPSMRGLNVVNNTGEPLPGLGELKGAEWFDSKGNAKRSKRGGGSKRISYWDFITDLCVGCGYICYIRTPTGSNLPPGTALPPAELVIDVPRTYYATTGDELRTFVYGNNVESMELQRDYAGRNIPTAVAVTAIEDVTGRHISARWPPSQTVNRAGGTSLPNTPAVGDREEVTTIVLNDRIPGTSAAQTLQRIASSIFEQLGRGEMRVKIATSRLSHLPSNVDQSKVDMLQLKSGDNIRVEVQATDEVTLKGDIPQPTTAGDWTKMALPDRIEFLVRSVGMNPIAAAVAATASTDQLNVQSEFRVTENVIQFDANDGFKFNVEAINFLDARNAVAESDATAALVAQQAELLNNLAKLGGS